MTYNEFQRKDIASTDDGSDMKSNNTNDIDSLEWAKQAYARLKEKQQSAFTKVLDSNSSNISDSSQPFVGGDNSDKLQREKIVDDMDEHQKNIQSIRNHNI